MTPDLIYDVGLHNGTDTAYYLHKGFRVVAIDANPVLVAAAQDRFRTEIANGRLTVLNIGIAEQEGTLSFWVNEANDLQSSFSEERAKRYGPCHEIPVRCIPFSSVLAEHGVPYYMKVDIEGYDCFCVGSLDPKDLPKHISVEADGDCDVVAELQKLGYTKFKLVNQLTFTDSMPITPDEFGRRFLRKLSVKLPLIKRALGAPSIASRLERTDFDSFREQSGYHFGPGSSGPFGDETFGKWRDAGEISARLRDIQRKLTAAQFPAGSYWCDVHATY